MFSPLYFLIKEKRGAIPVPPATNKAFLPTISNPFPYGPLTPTLFPSFILCKAFVASPTFSTVIPILSPI